MYKDEIEQYISALKHRLDSPPQEVQLTIAEFALQHAEDRPKLKPVDLSVLIESGIDCEFGEEEKEWIPGKLHSMRTRSPLYGERYTDTWNKYCRPRMNHVHAWTGGDCPLPEGLVVSVHTRNGILCLRESYDTDYWGHRNNADRKWDIIAFEVIGLADGWCWPWE